MMENIYIVRIFSFVLLLFKKTDAQCQSTTVCQCAFVADSVLTASSSLSPEFSPDKAKINNFFNASTINGTQYIWNGGSWQPGVNDPAPWFMVDIGAVKTIVSISTKGNSHYNSWIKEYNLYSKVQSSDSFYFQKKYGGNTNGHDAKIHKFEFKARYVKVVPLSFHNNVSLRIELTGCDQVDGGWTSWGAWRACRAPCGGSKQYRFRNCENPKPKFLGDVCENSYWDSQDCNTQSCPPTLMVLRLQLSSLTWTNDLLLSTASNELCQQIQSNVSAVYHPPDVSNFQVIISCTFFQIDTSKVEVDTAFSINVPNPMYIVMLQDALYSHQKIHNLPAILKNYTSVLAPYPPSVLSYVTYDKQYLEVMFSPSGSGVAALGFNIFYRLEATNPDGAWIYRNADNPHGACDFKVNSCFVFGTASFHNYTTRIIPFNGDGFGFGTDPYRVTAHEAKPSKPGNLAGEMRSSKSIQTSWSAVPLSGMNGNSLGYELQYARKGTNNFHSISIMDHWQTTLLITGLDEYVEYNIRMRSKNTRYYSDMTNTITVRTDEDIPASPPTNLAAAGETSRSLRVSWSRVVNYDENGIIRNYRIRYSTGTTLDEGNMQSVIVNDGNQLSYVIGGLNRWTHYTVQIAASTIKGTSVYSASKTARTHEDKPDVAPGNLRGNAASSTTIQLYWDMIPFAQRHGVLQQYRIHYQSAGHSGFADFNGESTLQGIVLNLWYWTSYNLRIQASTSAGFGPSSGAISIRTHEHPPTRPPENFIGVNTSSYSIRTQWDDVVAAYKYGVILGYTVNYKSAKDATWTTRVLNGVNNRTLEFSGLYNFTLYDISVSAFNSKGNGATAVIQVKTDDAIPTLPPSSITATKTSSTSLYVVWTRIPEISRHGIILGYFINYIDLALNLKRSIEKNNWGSLDKTLTSLEKFRRYRIEIAGYTKKGVGPYISTIAQTEEDLPSAYPTDFKGKVLSATATNLQWNNTLPPLKRNGIITKYRVSYWAVSNPFSIRHAEFFGNSSQSGNISGLHYWTYYNFSIAAGTSIGYGVQSGAITLRTEEHVPARAPLNFAGFNTSSYTVNISWQPIEGPYRHGIILGYNVTYISLFDNSSKTFNVYGEQNLTTEIKGLRNYTDYNVTIAGFNSKGSGEEAWVLIRTEETVPSLPPASLLSYNSSSSSLWIEWSKVPFESRRGIILGYFIVYEDVVYNVSRNLSIQGANILSHNLTGLEEFREYKISIAGFTKMGIGAFISTNAVTDEDIPSSPPIAISGNFLSSSELKITWKQPEGPDQNGKLVNVNVFYKLDLRTAPTRAIDGRKYYEMLLAKNISLLLRRRRSVFGLEDDYKVTYFNPVGQASLKQCDFSLITSPIQFSDQQLQKRQSRSRYRRSSPSLSGFNTIVLDANRSSVSLNSLDPYINYTIILQATTVKGAGPLSNPILVETDESVPSTPPQNIATNFTSSTSILTKWQPVPLADANGIVYAYIISVKRANSSETWVNHVQYEPVLQYNITGLRKYVVYTLKVSAVTSKGLGPFSTEVHQRTDEDIPSAPPANVSAESLSSTILRINWNPVPENGEPSCCLHGILTGYRVLYGKRYPEAGDTMATIVVPPHQQLIDLASLGTYTPYTIDVAAMTVKGLGPNGRVHIWTSESTPILAPQNVTLKNNTSTSLLIEWNELPFPKRKGEIRGYAVYYKVRRSTHSLSVKWLDMYLFTKNYTVVYRPPVQMEMDDVIRQLFYELEGLYKFTEYIVHLTAYTKEGTGPWTYAKFEMTDEDVPSKSAENVTAVMVNSTAILVSWDSIAVVYDPTIETPICCVHGILTGYTIFYTRVTKAAVHNVSIDLSYFERMKNSTVGGNATNATASSRMHYTLTELDSYKNYTIYVAGNTRKGYGVLGQPVYVVTDQDLPAREPDGIRAWNISSTSLHVEWDKIIWEYRNGIILYYTIYYRETNNPFEKERSFNVPAKYNSTKITNLRKWTFYDIRIYGATIKGEGLVSANITVRTDTDVPTMPPQSLTAVDYTGPFSILMKWNPIPPEHRHGEILFYKILYFKYSEADKELKNRAKFELLVSSSKHEVYLENLSTFATYGIKILGMTNQGDGAHSKEIFAKTCRCAKHLYTNWWPYPPYIYKEGINGDIPTAFTKSDVSYVPNGIFGKFIRDMAIWGCQNCNGPRGHGYSVVHFNSDETGRKSIRDSLAECIGDANENLDLTFIVQGRLNQDSFLSGGKFLELAEHPLAALVVLKKVKIISKSAAMKNAMFSLWPMVVLFLLLASLSGIIIWFLDSTANPEEFPPTVFKGMWNGLWWAYVTMTTVGYGDITPRSYSAKIFSIIWILIGLVVYAILCSGVTSALFVKKEIINQKVEIYNNEIAVVAGTVEEQLVINKVGKAIKKKTAEEVLDMVKRDKIDGALVDSFVLSLYESVFKNSSLYVQKTLRSSSVIGVGLSGNMTKLSNVFVDYVHSNQKYLTENIEKFVRVFKSDEGSVAVEGESDSMFQANSPIYQKLIYGMSIFIGVAFIFGIFFNVWRHRKKAREDLGAELLKENKILSKMDESFTDINNVTENFVTSLEKRIDMIEREYSEKCRRLFNIHRYLDRCEHSGENPTLELERHEIFIDNWDKIHRERELLLRMEPGCWIKKLFWKWKNRRILPEYGNEHN